ncbi:restriction endonuclease [Candidatus Saccharibacteria bacterium]|nr:restriction endonuclease [Candidatus Saccharibacteria bacterium]
MRRSPMLIFLMIILTVAYWQYAQYVLALIVIFYIVRLIARVYQFARRIITNLRLSDVDMMDGLVFEKYVANLLKQQGYSNISLTEQYDYGVDIIATRDGICWGIQVKRHSGLVKADAVRQVVTGLRVYECDRAMVVTNSVFSRVAIQLAKSNECVLVDRSELARMKTDLKW